MLPATKKLNIWVFGSNLRTECNLQTVNLLTWTGTAWASTCGISFGSRRRLTWSRNDPDSTFAKKTFQIVNINTFLHAVRSVWLSEMNPWMEENNIMMGGTRDWNKWRMRLGRYPVMTWPIIALQLKKLNSLVQSLLLPL